LPVKRATQSANVLPFFLNVQPFYLNVLPFCVNVLPFTLNVGTLSRTFFRFFGFALSWVAYNVVAAL
jgi:hypothetical protein